MEITEKLIKKIINKRPQTEEDLSLVVRQCLRQEKNDGNMPNKASLLKAYHKLVKENKIKAVASLEKLLTKRAVRTLSGVSVVTVLTKPFKCPGQCIYCPNEVNMPKSYLADEPAAARAKMLKFDPYQQMIVRLTALKNNGHPTDKVELIVKGGTWNSYSLKYQYWFICQCFAGANKSKIDVKPSDAFKKIKTTLEREQKKNETTKSRIIGLTLETRPDEINPESIRQMRELGCTRLEIGIQTIDKKILKDIKRGHTLQDVIDATRLLKQYGFKVDYHLMPQLPGSTPGKDIKMIREVFDNPDYRPDMIKIYPCTVVKNSPLFTRLKQGKYRPYSDKKLIEVLKTVKSFVPRYVRISRLIRDIPGHHIKAGNRTTNLRQIIQAQMKEEGLSCNCLRCREVGHQKITKKIIPKLFIDKYTSSGGEEYFISFEDNKRKTVLAFCRLRIDKSSLYPAFIRELHTYGQLIKIGQDGRTASQHKGMGVKLIKEAEKIVKKEKVNKLAIISGIGVKKYYKKLGYKPENTYMVKNI